ncbi:unnamed protein product [Cladocopium goreaui]|uniref:Metallo-beta-lactamase domain-containing protein 2 n=1 Tax=Cladocopium goreaui TaxID=2562237 RepID=A0A9P1GGW6_9DINO|nr:unnamed protein product [Cladocopium goreaui]
MDSDRPWPFEVHQLSQRTLVIIESDRFGELPHIYAVLGPKKAIIIDTGCNTASLRDFLETLSCLEGKEFQVVNTHIHYDHIMGNYGFSMASQRRCRGICQGSRSRAFSENWKANSLQDMVGASILDFAVTDWLDEGARIYLNDDEPTDEESLEILHTPGHTPDSISLYLPAENRLFSGDLIYPGSLFLYLPGSSLEDFRESLHKLRAFIASKPEGCGYFGQFAMAMQADPNLLSLLLSCGHIDPELPAKALEELYKLLDDMKQGAAQGRPTRNNLTSFSTRHFTLMCRSEDVSH